MLGNKKEEEWKSPQNEVTRRVDEARNGIGAMVGI